MIANTLNTFGSPSGNRTSPETFHTLPDGVWVDFVASMSVGQGWDGRRAPAPAPAAIANATRVLDACAWLLRGSRSTKYEIAPSIDGGINIVVERRAVWLSALCMNDGQVRIERSDDVERLVDGWPTLGTDADILWLLKA